MKKYKMCESRPVAIYNTVKKEVIGVFETQSLLARYLFPPLTNHTSALVGRSLLYKGRILKSIFPFPVATRYANESQIKLLNGGGYVTMEGYPIANYSKMKGFDSTSESMRKEFIEKKDIFNAERKRKKTTNEKE